MRRQLKIITNVVFKEFFSKHITSMGLLNFIPSQIHRPMHTYNKSNPII